MNKKVISIVLLIIVFSVIIGIYSIDMDSLSYAEEQKHNTDPLDYDTDNDGLSDSYEINNGYNPRKKTILVSIKSTKPINGEVVKQLHTIQEVYADAPVQNPDGSTGINVIFVIEQVDIDEGVSNVTIDEYSEDIQPETFDKQGKGFYEIVLVDYIYGDNGSNNISGTADMDSAGAIVEYRDQQYKVIYDKNNNIIGMIDGNKSTGVTIAHELGHLLGIRASYEGVDSTEKTTAEYPSIMNYNKPNNIQYADSDWNIIEQNLQYTTNTSNIDNIMILSYKYIVNNGSDLIDKPYITTHKIVSDMDKINEYLFEVMYVLTILVLLNYLFKLE